jgi:hypothetical protein
MASFFDWGTNNQQLSPDVMRKRREIAGMLTPPMAENPWSIIQTAKPLPNGQQPVFHGAMGFLPLDPQPTPADPPAIPAPRPVRRGF